MRTPDSTKAKLQDIQIKINDIFSDLKSIQKELDNILESSNHEPKRSRSRNTVEIDNTSGKFVDIYTDGSCLKNPGGPGGWAAAIIYNSIFVHLAKGGEKSTTNNRMEIQAAIEGLAAVNSGCTVRIYSDSQYVIKGATEWMPNWKRRNWKTSEKESVKNVDLWVELEKQIQRHRKVDWFWVKAHNGNPYNELVDKESRDQARQAS